MIKQIRNCQKCGLCINQKPLLDTEKQCQVFWVGLSAKKAMTNTEIPLSPNTNTGMIIQKIEKSCCNVSTYKTNLVKCLPLSEQQKLPCQVLLDMIHGKTVPDKTLLDYEIILKESTKG